MHATQLTFAENAKTLTDKIHIFVRRKTKVKIYHKFKTQKTTAKIQLEPGKKIQTTHIQQR